MSEAGTPQPARPNSRWLVVALLTSLALNLLIVGWVAGAIWRFHRPPAWTRVITPNLLGYASTLPRERRKQLWDATAEERRHLRPLRREVRAAREATIKILSVEPFDREHFLAAQTRQAAAEDRAHEAVRSLYAKLADVLTPEERRAFPGWRAHRRHPSQNLLDEPDQQAGEPVKR